MHKRMSLTSDTVHVSRHQLFSFLPAVPFFSPYLMIKTYENKIRKKRGWSLSVCVCARVRERAAMSQLDLAVYSERRKLSC